MRFLRTFAGVSRQSRMGSRRSSHSCISSPSERISTASTGEPLGPGTVRRSPTVPATGECRGTETKEAGWAMQEPFFTWSPFVTHTSGGAPTFCLPEDRAILLRNHPISSRRQPILPAEKFHAFLTNRKRKLMKELKLPAGIVKCRSFRFCSNGWIGLITPSGVYKQRLFIFLWILSVLSSKNAVGVIIHRIMKEGGLFQVSFSETLEA